jgi:hydroxymethylglutaryl-CoA lyase
MPERIRITDVSPRDGLQNEPRAIPAADKVRLVQALAVSGVDEVEVSSFVSPRWIPQLGDAADVFAALAAGNLPASSGPIFSALVPNEKGMESALRINQQAGRPVIGKIAVFTAASETFAQRNINASIAESIRRFEPVFTAARRQSLPVRGYISCIIECPFEGRIAPDKVGHVAQALCDAGADELDLGDTIGAAEAESITLLINQLLGRLGDDILARLTLHLHDTYGRAAECVREAVQLGIRSFDGAVAGLGGCPYASTAARRAPGNIDTHLLVRTVRDMGYTTGVDDEKLAEAAALARALLAAAPAAAPAAEQRP